jgi:hypothetical protein
MECFLDRRILKYPLRYSVSEESGKQRRNCSDKRKRGRALGTKKEVT